MPHFFVPLQPLKIEIYIMSDDKKIIFSMVGVSKTYPPQKQVLKDIYLSFYYGAKIGILGLNGSGKSTLLKIIAGEEKSFQGEVVFSPGYSVGYLAQEPKLDETKTAKEIVMEGVQPIVNILKEYEEVNNKFSEPMDDEAMNKLIERQGVLMDQIEQHGAWELDNKIEVAMDALRCPEGDSSVKTYRVENGVVLHSVGCCYRSPIFCCLMSPQTTLMRNR